MSHRYLKLKIDINEHESDMADNTLVYHTRSPRFDLGSNQIFTLMSSLEKDQQPLESIFVHRNSSRKIRRSEPALKL